MYRCRHSLFFFIQSNKETDLIVLHFAQPTINRKIKLIYFYFCIVSRNEKALLYSDLEKYTIDGNKSRFVFFFSLFFLTSLTDFKTNTALLFFRTNEKFTIVSRRPTE